MAGSADFRSSTGMCPTLLGVLAMPVLRLRPALRSRGLPEGAADLEQRADSDHAESDGCQS
jgi:hypothetical protein